MCCRWTSEGRTFLSGDGRVSRTLAGKTARRVIGEGVVFPCPLDVKRRGWQRLQPLRIHHSRQDGENYTRLLTKGKPTPNVLGMNAATYDRDTRPKYLKVKRDPNGAVDSRGRAQMCQTHPNTPATWTGNRRPAARIMVYPFSYCDECWKERMT